jgi:hypothetical protein
MDERSSQVEMHRDRPKSLGEFRMVSSWGFETAGSREHEMLVAEGHYRCSCCRRPDIDELNSPARRMR